MSEAMSECNIVQNAVGDVAIVHKGMPCQAWPERPCRLMLDGDWLYEICPSGTSRRIGAAARPVSEAVRRDKVALCVWMEGEQVIDVEEFEVDVVHWSLKGEER